MNFKIISNFLGVNFFLTHTVQTGKKVRLLTERYTLLVKVHPQSSTATHFSPSSTNSSGHKHVSWQGRGQFWAAVRSAQVLGQAVPHI